MSDDEPTIDLPGFFAGVFTGTSLIVFLKYPMSRYYAILGLPAGRVYSAVIMDTLLVRHSLREKIKGGKVRHVLSASLSPQSNTDIYYEDTHQCPRAVRGSGVASRHSDFRKRSD
ncbi:hypothetical protein DXG01_008509 [Tephrocybe rancida]|nr:hypothetical protein DXG01_008509 [Tephrocybe rancida]